MSWGIPCWLPLLDKRWAGASGQADDYNACLSINTATLHTAGLKSGYGVIKAAATDAETLAAAQFALRPGSGAARHRGSGAGAGAAASSSSSSSSAAADATAAAAAINARFPLAMSASASASSGLHGPMPLLGAGIGVVSGSGVYIGGATTSSTANAAANTAAAGAKTAAAGGSGPASSRSGGVGAGAASSSSAAPAAPAQAIVAGGDIYRQAMAQLQLSAVPPSMPCREKERGEILATLDAAIRNGGSGQALYISGMPGTGKTATITGGVQPPVAPHVVLASCHFQPTCQPLNTLRFPLLMVLPLNPFLAEVVRELNLRKRDPANPLPDFHYFEINAMKVPNVSMGGAQLGRR